MVIRIFSSPNCNGTLLSFLIFLTEKVGDSFSLNIFNISLAVRWFVLSLDGKTVCSCIVNFIYFLASVMQRCSIAPTYKGRLFTLSDQRLYNICQRKSNFEGEEINQSEERRRLVKSLER